MTAAPSYGYVWAYRYADGPVAEPRAASRAAIVAFERIDDPRETDAIKTRLVAGGLFVLTGHTPPAFVSPRCPVETCNAPSPCRGCFGQGQVAPSTSRGYVDLTIAINLPEHIACNACHVLWDRGRCPKCGAPQTSRAA